MNRKVFIWKCADACCLRYSCRPTMHWHVGLGKHKPSADFITFNRALNYFRTMWIGWDITACEVQE